MRSPTTPRRGLPVQPSTITLAVVDAALIHAWVTGDLASAATLGLHWGTVLGLLATLTAIGRPPNGETMAIAALAALLGPPGGLGLLAMEVGRRWRVAEPGRDPATGAPPTTSDMPTAECVHAAITQGRRHPGGEAEPAGFLGVLKTGSLAERQAAIATISRAYRPEMRSALQAALASDIPAVRVQAAAVYAKLRARFSARGAALLTDSTGSDAAAGAARAEEAREIAQSGFVDAATAARLTALARREDTVEVPPSLCPAAVAPAPPPVSLHATRRWRYAFGGLV